MLYLITAEFGLDCNISEYCMIFLCHQQRYRNKIYFRDTFFKEYYFLYFYILHVFFLCNVCVFKQCVCVCMECFVYAIVRYITKSKLIYKSLLKRFSLVLSYWIQLESRIYCSPFHMYHAEHFKVSCAYCSWR